METRAHHILIGIFMLGMLAGLLAFVLWAMKINIDTEFDYYDIYFTESVAGLTVGGDVTYNGVNVGEVTRIAIDPEDPSRVRVTIRVVHDTPIREDAQAVLEFQGLTGLSYVQISGGSAEAPPLKAKPGQENPVIASQPSQIQELFAGAPDLIRRAIILVDRLTKLVDEPNRQALSRTLANLETLSDRLAAKADTLARVIDNADTTLVELRQASASVRELAGTTNTVIDQDLRALIADLRTTSGSIRDLSDGLSATVLDNREALVAFSSTTLPEVALLVQQARQLTTSISRIAERFERAPIDFMLSGKKPEYQAK